MKPLQSAIQKTPFLLAGALILGASVRAQERCGGVERWAVKMAADSDSNQINRQPIPISIHDIGKLEKGEAIPDDEAERLPTERNVYLVDGFLVKFKLEAGKTGDSDFHLVVTDETLTFSPDSHHSVIAEIVDPDCVEGRKGTVSSPTVFASEMAAAKAALEAQFRSERRAVVGLMRKEFPCESRG